MSVDAALPQPLNEQKCENVLTFIVPAPEGCNLGCSFCFINRRGEQTSNGLLGSADYVRFVHEMRVGGQPIDAICLQGYEPLLPVSFPFTKEILKAAKNCGLPTGLVTNGTYLAVWAEELADFAPNKIAISIDAADSEVHDLTRRKSGAWQQTMIGLLTALEVLPPTTEIVVTSVLLPKKMPQLLEMPRILSSIGVKDWVISPLLKVGKTSGGVAGDKKAIWRDLIELSKQAAQYDIDFTVDDNLGTLSIERAHADVVDIEMFRIRMLKKPSSLIRLLPSGQCSVGEEILSQVSISAPIWLPGSVNAGDFIRKLRARHNLTQTIAA